MTTIFITSFNPFIARNLLSGDFFNILKEKKDLRVVVFVPDYKVKFFQEYYSGPNVVIEGIAPTRPSRREIFFKYLVSSLVSTKTLLIHKKEKLAKDRKWARYLISIFLMAIGNWAAVKRLTRWFDYFLADKKRLSVFFEKYKPDLVFATDVFNDEDVNFLATAKSRVVKTAGMIRSWDNVSTKGLFRMKPDRLVVHNQIIKSEVLRHEDMADSKVATVGIPQFDIYFAYLEADTRRLSSVLQNTRIRTDKIQRGSAYREALDRRQSVSMRREEFFLKLGFDPTKKLILFSPFGNRFWDLDWQILEILQNTGYQILARLTPQDAVSLGKFKLGANVYVDQPGKHFTPGIFRDTELTPEDLHWLADSLYHSDLVVTCGATLGIDAAIFDKPVILVGFDGYENRPYLKSVKRFLDFDHPQSVFRTGAFKVAKSKKELLAMIDAYLKNSALDKENRAKMVAEQCYKTDGRAGERLATFLIS